MPWEISSLFEKYPQDGGRIETNIIDTGGNKSQPRVLKALYDKPEQTDAEFLSEPPIVLLIGTEPILNGRVSDRMKR